MWVMAASGGEWFSSWNIKLCARKCRNSVYGSIDRKHPTKTISETTIITKATTIRFCRNIILTTE